MKTILFFTTLLSTTTALLAQTPTALPADRQIKLATMAAPDDKRDGAMVYGYSDQNEFTILRKGTNEFVCLTDDPAQKGFSVSCYHRDLEPFMARGRALKKEGKKADEILEIREKEAKAKTLKMPVNPSSLYVYSAKDEEYDPATGEVKNGYLRSVVYIPYATAESTGLPLKPAAPGMPWIMDPGTHRAHIMINPAPPATK